MINRPDIAQLVKTINEHIREGAEICDVEFIPSTAANIPGVWIFRPTAKETNDERSGD